MTAACRAKGRLTAMDEKNYTLTITGTSHAELQGLLRTEDGIVRTFESTLELLKLLAGNPRGLKA